MTALPSRDPGANGRIRQDAGTPAAGTQFLAPLPRHPFATGEFALAQSLPLHVFVIDLAKRQYTFLNRRALLWLGHDPATPAERVPLLAHTHVDDQARLETALQRLQGLADGQVLDLEFRSLRADGTWRHVLGSMSVYRRGAEGEVEQVIATAQDITDRVTLEAQLRHAQKMEAVGQLAGGVAHDFNNLLTVILGYAETLSSGLPDDDPIRLDAQQIVRAGRQAAALTQQLLASARRQPREPAPLRLALVYESLGPMLRRLLPENIEIRFDAGATRGWLRADPGQIEQVMMNLAVNARDAMPEGGALVISTADVEVNTGDAWHHAGAGPGPYVRLRFEDSGTGMDGEVRSRIFEPFFTTKSADRGTGLGLSVVYGIVQDCEGHIMVHSAPGRGARFDLLFPAVAAAEIDAPEAAPPAVRTCGLETVLLVEDDPAVRRMQRRGLETHGYHVIEAAGGEEALARARGFDRPIHVAISDLVMPGMGGGTFARRLEDIHPETRMMFVSGYPDDLPLAGKDTKRSRDYLQKPITPAALARAVRRALTPAPASP